MRGISVLLTFGLVGVMACRKDVAAPVLPCNQSTVAITTLDTVGASVVVTGVPAQLDPCGTAPINNTTETTTATDTLHQRAVP